MKLPPTSSANTATRNDAQAKSQTEREAPAMVESHTIPSQNVTEARPLCTYGYWSVQTPDQSCTYGWAWTLHHYAVYRS
jgi:hypothetical protein